MRAVVTAALALALIIVPFNVRAASDKVLSNVKGSVSYEDSGKTTQVAPNGSIALTDKETAITGDASLGKLQLPDSSVVTLGSQTRVQLAFFNQTDVANAQFVIYQGKTRFKVEHPEGAKANYTFVTPTSSIAVRGTEGDIGVDGDSLTVNVYSASQPVSVAFSGGKVQLVNAGQSLTAKIVNGVVQLAVNKLTQAAVDQFAGDFGVPTNWNDLKNQLLNQLPSIPRDPLLASRFSTEFRFSHFGHAPHGVALPSDMTTTTQSGAPYFFPSGRMFNFVLSSDGATRGMLSVSQYACAIERKTRFSAAL